MDYHVLYEHTVPNIFVFILLIRIMCNEHGTLRVKKVQISQKAQGIELDFKLHLKKFLFYKTTGNQHSYLSLFFTGKMSNMTHQMNYYKQKSILFLVVKIMPFSF